MDYILELSKTLNFNRAAENLFISQSTLTYNIQEIEKEIGFQLFNRTGKGVTLTPAGIQFITSIRTIREDLKKAIEQGQNFSLHYDEDLKICLPLRSALYFLPEIILEFAKIRPSISISPEFIYSGGVDSFLRGEYDFYFGYANELKRVSEVKAHPLFDSHIYLITQKEDSLASKTLITMNDLENRTLMIGGGSPPPLRAVQQRIISQINLSYFNSHDHDTTLTNVAANRGVCLAPGFLNDHNDEFAWIPFECNETIPCTIYTHSDDTRDSIKKFLKIMKQVYANHKDFAL